jgi:hypothetical protein
MYDGSVWQAPTVLLANADLRSVSCASSSFCAVIGSYGFDQNIAFTFSSGKWSAPTIVETGQYLAGVSCVSTSFCLGVDAAGNSFEYNGIKWGLPKAIYAKPGTSTSGVSCSSAQSCYVVNAGGFATRYDGLTWGAPHYVNVNGTGGLSAISCSSAYMCVALDDYGYAVIFDGTSWTAPEYVFAGTSISCPSSSFCLATDNARTGVVTLDHGVWGAPTPVIADGSLRVVSCVSATECKAIDDSGDVINFDGVSWSTPIHIGSDLYALSCGATKSCMVLDTVGPLSFNGTSWTPTGTGTYNVTDLSCSGPTFCMATSYTHGGTFVFDGTRWTHVGDSEPGPGILATSCASPFMCVAVFGPYQTVQFSGSSWAYPTSNEPNRLAAVSCPSEAFCMAVDTVGRAIRGS